MLTEQIFPFANVVVGILIFVVGFIFHWVGQLISIINWDLAVKLTLQEEKSIPAFKVYEHAIATADVILGWTYGIIALGLILDFSWAYKLLWIPAVVFVYHSISFWFWTKNQNNFGNPVFSFRFRIVWFTVNIGTGLLGILIAWNN
ncbi:MAG: hypothetical protein ACW981_09410 [Candidatus Hodarchaeales archaeon]